MVTPANVIRMDELDKSETIVGLSYLKGSRRNGYNDH